MWLMVCIASRLETYVAYRIVLKKMPPQQFNKKKKTQVKKKQQQKKKYHISIVFSPKIFFIGIIKCQHRNNQF